VSQPSLGYNPPFLSWKRRPLPPPFVLNLSIVEKFLALPPLLSSPPPFLGRKSTRDSVTFTTSGPSSTGSLILSFSTSGSEEAPLQGDDKRIDLDLDPTPLSSSPPPPPLLEELT